MAWERLGGVLASAPAVSSWGGGRLDCFVRGTDGAIWHLWSDGSVWNGWESLGGSVTSAPASVSRLGNRISCFARGASNELLHNSYEGNSWGGWKSLGGNLTSAPAVSSWGNDRLDCFVRGQDNAMWHLWFDGTNWLGWESLGGNLASAPAVVSVAPGRIECFVLGTDSAMWHKSFDGSDWSGWSNLGGALSSAPAVCSGGPGRLECFARGQGGDMLRLGFDGVNWSQWQSLGGALTSNPATASSKSGRVDCFVRGADNAMWRRWYEGNDPGDLTSWKPTSPLVRLHLKILEPPTQISVGEMVKSMQEVYAAYGIEVTIESQEELNLPQLEDLDVGTCSSGSMTNEQLQLFSNRNNVMQRDVAVYFVRSTQPVFNGCAAHPNGRPSAVIASIASRWTLAHEVGHVLGLGHVDDLNRLMTRHGTANITDPPPDLTDSELQTILSSPWTVTV